MPHIAGNIGFVFTHEDLADIRDVLESNKKEAPAKAGAIAPLDVHVPKGNTGMGPEKTSFFQALAIPTKITKGLLFISQIWLAFRCPFFEQMLLRMSFKVFLYVQGGIAVIKLLLSASSKI